MLICSILIIAVAASRIDYEGDAILYNDFLNENVYSYITSREFIELLIYSVVLSFFVNFVRQIDRLLGQNVLLNYVRGKYQLPLEEELIFMFLDLEIIYNYCREDRTQKES